MYAYVCVYVCVYVGMCVCVNDDDCFFMYSIQKMFLFYIHDTVCFKVNHTVSMHSLKSL